MNNTFSLRRILQYGRKHYIENAKQYLYGLSAFWLTLFLVAFYIIWRGGKPIDYSSFSIPSILLMMAFYYFIIRISCRSHYRPISMPHAYTLPVTPLEKYLFIWFNSTIVASSLFLGMILFVKFAMNITYDNTGYPPYYFPYMAWLMLLLIQSGLLFASCICKRDPMKWFVILAILYCLFFILYFRKLWFIPNASVHLPLSEITIYQISDKTRFSYELPKQLSEAGSYLMIFGYWAVAAWIVGYFKFKERTLK